MTREEKQKAIDALKISAPVMAMTQEEFNDYIQTLNKVMDWLEQEPTKNDLEVDCIKKSDVIDIIQDMHGLARADVISDAVNRIITMPSVTPQPCEDAISRQAAIDCLDWSYPNELPITKIKNLPSVTPQEPRKGHWITQWNLAHQKEYYYCSECREEYSYDGETGIKMNDYKYCPNCGSRNEVKNDKRSNRVF